MMHFYLNATCIFGQPISIRCGRVKKKEKKTLWGIWKDFCRRDGLGIMSLDNSNKNGRNTALLNHNISTTVIHKVGVA